MFHHTVQLRVTSQKELPILFFEYDRFNMMDFLLFGKELLTTSVSMDLLKYSNRKSLIATWKK